MLDKLKAKYRHLIISAAAGFLGAILTAFVTAITAAKGITGVDWPVALKTALDTGALGALATFGLLTSSKLTKQYGAGSGGGDSFDVK